MNLADRLTASRLILAPLFFIIFTWGESLGIASALVAGILMLLFAVIELSDLLDGQAARRQGTVSAFGKLFDPFADVFARITYFVCFAFAGIMPLWMLLIILYREFCQLFLRMLLAEKGIAMGARPGGKLKAVFYMLAGAFSLLLWSLPKFGNMDGLKDPLSAFVIILYSLAVLSSVGSFIDYYLQFRKLTRQS